MEVMKPQLQVDHTFIPVSSLLQQHLDLAGAIATNPAIHDKVTRKFCRKTNKYTQPKLIKLPRDLRKGERPRRLLFSQISWIAPSRLLAS